MNEYLPTTHNPLQHTQQNANSVGGTCDRLHTRAFRTPKNVVYEILNKHASFVQYLLKCLACEGGSWIFSGISWLAKITSCRIRGCASSIVRPPKAAQSTLFIVVKFNNSVARTQGAYSHAPSRAPGFFFLSSWNKFFNPPPSSLFAPLLCLLLPTCSVAHRYISPLNKNQNIFWIGEVCSPLNSVSGLEDSGIV